MLDLWIEMIAILKVRSSCGWEGQANFGAYLAAETSLSACTSILIFTKDQRSHLLSGPSDSSQTARHFQALQPWQWVRGVLCFLTSVSGICLSSQAFTFCFPLRIKQSFLTWANKAVSGI